MFGSNSQVSYPNCPFRGIVLKSESVGMDAWLTALSEALSAHAGTSAQALDALRRIGG